MWEANLSTIYSLKLVTSLECSNMSSSNTTKFLNEFELLEPNTVVFFPYTLIPMLWVGGVRKKCRFTI